MKRFVFFVILLFSISCKLFVSPVFAKDFSSFYKTVYEFNNSGRGFVQQEISLVNETADVYVSEYTLSLNGAKIENIEAYDKVGPVKIEKLVKDETTLIKISFNEKQAGKGKILSFVLKYQTTDLAVKKGNLWEITIPKIGNPDSIDTCEIILKVPFSLGNLAYINPVPVSKEKLDKFYEIKFNKEQLSSFGAFAVFGLWQSLNFDLSYELANNSDKTVIQEIAIPSDTSYQDIYYDYLDPLPEDVVIDNDGNWLAKYLLKKDEKITIKAKGYANIFLSSKKDFPKQQENLNQYLKEDKYWEISNEEISKLAKKLETPKNIYQFVVKTLSYDKSLIDSEISRNGALSALHNPDKSLCSEFSDLFIALCRAAGIPARELEGYAYTENSKIITSAENRDILHSWPEYFDASTGNWIMVDPTFENTTGGFDYFNNLDMNHFAFVVHGAESDYPYPAGSYKSNVSEKQVLISFGKSIEPNIDLTFNLEQYSPKKIYSSKDNAVNFVFKNHSGRAVYNETIALNNDFFSQQNFVFKAIPPFSKITVNSTVKPKETFLDYNFESKILFGGKNYSSEFKVESLGLRLIILTAISVSAFLFIILRSLRKEKNTLQ